MAKIISRFFFILCVISLTVHASSNLGELKIPLQASQISLDPTHIQDVSSLFVSRQINCQLVRNQGSVFNFDAAESIKYLSPLRIMVILSSSAKFIDNSAVTSTDVAAVTLPANTGPPSH